MARYLRELVVPMSPAVVFSSELFVSESEVGTWFFDVAPFCMDIERTGPLDLQDILVTALLDCISKSVSELLTHAPFSGSLY